MLSEGKPFLFLSTGAGALYLYELIFLLGIIVGFWASCMGLRPCPHGIYDLEGKKGIK